MQDRDGYNTVLQLSLQENGALVQLPLVLVALNPVLM